MLSSHTLPVLARLTTSLTPVPFPRLSVPRTPSDRPLFFEFPHDTSLFEAQDAFMVGSALLVQPVVTAGATSAEVALPGGGTQVWYDYETFQRYSGGRTARVDAPLGRTPVFLRGGTVVPRRDRVRRASDLMHGEPLTLVVAADGQGRADGVLYLDDGESYAFEKGVYAFKTISLSANRLTAADATESLRAQHADGRAAFRAANRVAIERIILVGLPSIPKRVDVTAAGQTTALEFAGSKTPYGTVVVHLKRPVANAADNWEISLTL